VDKFIQFFLLMVANQMPREQLFISDVFRSILPARTGCQGRRGTFYCAEGHKCDCDSAHCRPECVRRVDTIRRQLPGKDQRLVDLFLEENGNYSAVARRLGRHRTSVSDSYSRLFHRIKASA
jgi:hypothetical protein